MTTKTFSVALHDASGTELAEKTGYRRAQGNFRLESGIWSNTEVLRFGYPTCSWKPIEIVALLDEGSEITRGRLSMTTRAGVHSSGWVVEAVFKIGALTWEPPRFSPITNTRVTEAAKPAKAVCPLCGSPAEIVFRCHCTNQKCRNYELP